MPGLYWESAHLTVTFKILSFEYAFCAVCKAETTNGSRAGTLHWPETYVSQTVTVACPSSSGTGGGSASATRVCVEDFGGATWLPPDTDSCAFSSPTTQGLELLAMVSQPRVKSSPCWPVVRCAVQNLPIAQYCQHPAVANNAAPNKFNVFLKLVQQSLEIPALFASRKLMRRAILYVAPSLFSNHRVDMLSLQALQVVWYIPDSQT